MNVRFVSHLCRNIEMLVFHAKVVVGYASAWLGAACAQFRLKGNFKYIHMRAHFGFHGDPVLQL